jgi:methionine synthase II (cobalamin-independent)
LSPIGAVSTTVNSARSHSSLAASGEPRNVLPDGKIIVPGVIESKSNFIEHPDLIAQRIARYAYLVGRDNVIADA